MVSSSSPPPWPALSPGLGEGDDEDDIQGEGSDGAGSGTGVAENGGGSADLAGIGRFGMDETAMPAEAAEAAEPLVEVRPVGAKGMGLFSTR